MKKLHSTDNVDEIRGMYEFLRRFGVPVSVTENGSVVELWLVQSAYETRAQELLTLYRSMPESERQQPIQPSSKVVSPLIKTFTKQAGLFTFGIALLVLIVALLQYLDLQRTVQWLLITEPPFGALDSSQPWRIVTPAFLHFSAMHLVFNLFWWWYLGGRIELHLGSKALIGLFFFTAIVSNLAQFMLSGPNFGGLSGVVYGLLGFSTIMSLGRGGPLWLPSGLVIFMVAWLVVGYMNILWVNMANEAHLGGLLSGILAGVFVRYFLRK
ncbi:MAG: rhomboid family intramembrane serine protease [Idiomarina sp.]|nr:rhomboid family intramembrane serine protease [Idiomarina sp.]